MGESNDLNSYSIAVGLLLQLCIPLFFTVFVFTFSMFKTIPGKIDLAMANLSRNIIDKIRDQIVVEDFLSRKILVVTLTDIIPLIVFLIGSLYLFVGAYYAKTQGNYDSALWKLIMVIVLSFMSIIIYVFEEKIIKKKWDCWTSREIDEMIYDDLDDSP